MRLQNERYELWSVIGRKRSFVLSRDNFWDLRKAVETLTSQPDQYCNHYAIFDRRIQRTIWTYKDGQWVDYAEEIKEYEALNYEQQGR